MDLKDLARNKNAISRAICAENPTGEKNQGNLLKEGVNAKASYDAGLGQGWKVSPCVLIKAHSNFDICNIFGEGHINHIWFTCDSVFYSSLVFKGYFDDLKEPCIDSPLGAFFLNGWGRRANVSSLAICVNPSGGLNSYFVMPFRKNAHLVMENNADVDVILYYQVDYTLDKVLDDEMYFHAFYNFVERLDKKTCFNILPKIDGEGSYVGTYFGFKTDFVTWWGEGEFLFYIDDDEHPSICTTGTEDYFGGAWNFEQPKGHYHLFSTPYSGFIDVYPQDEIYVKEQECGMYRFHVVDPIYFKKNIKVEVEAIGWEEDFSKYRSLSPKLFSVAYYYKK